MRRGEGRQQKNETPTDEDTSLHPFKTHPMSNPVGAIKWGRTLWGPYRERCKAISLALLLNKKHAYSRHGLFFYIIRMVMIVAADKPGKKLLSNLHMCWQSATCTRPRNTLFDDLGTLILPRRGFMFVLSVDVWIGSYAPSFPQPTDVQLIISSLLAFAGCGETFSYGIRFVAKPAVHITFM